MATSGSSVTGSKLSAEAAVFVPQGNYLIGNTVANVASNSGAVAITDSAMLKLLSNPEALFEVVNPLADRLSTAITDSATLEAVVEHIFQQSIFQSNYQYTGARLCNILSNKLNITFENGGFRDVLFKQCEVEYNRREELSKTEDGLEELAGFTLFLAEFVLNLRIEGLINRFALRIFDLLLLLLSTANADAIKCVNKVLKLTGSTLELENSEKMNEIFTRVKDVIVHSGTSRQIRSILLLLVELRAQNWEAEGGAAPTATMQNGHSGNHREPEFRDENEEIVYEYYPEETGYDYGVYAGYVPDGYIAGAYDHINEEDYETWVPAEENNEFDGIQCVIGNDEMDPEMDEAYEQFLEQLKSSSAETSGK